MNKEKPIAVYYEHPDWFRPLFAELDRRGTPYVRLDARCHSYDASAKENEYALVFNRMSASAYLRGNANTTFYTRDYLAHLERRGVRVVNGSASFAIETSKAAQLNLLASLELAYPRTRIINCAREAMAAARDFEFPIIVKPNIGGRGEGIVRYDSLKALTHAVEEEQVDLGIDGTALVQEYVRVRGGHITRVETLDGKFLYAMKVYTTGENFNLCPAEICQVDGVAVANEVCLVDAPQTGLVIEPYTPPDDVVAAVERIAAAARMDMGGVEYMIDDRDGRLMYYDINALSNFVADAPRILGFDPHARLVDFLERERKIA